jgi:hypothetical protein
MKKGRIGGADVPARRQQSRMMLIGIPCMLKLARFVFIEAPIPRKQSRGQDLIDMPQSA